MRSAVVAALVLFAAPAFAGFRVTPVKPPPVELARLPAERDLDLLRRFVEPWVERPGEWKSFWSGRFGSNSWSFGPKLRWSLFSTETREAADPISLFDDTLARPRVEAPRTAPRLGLLPDLDAPLTQPSLEGFFDAPRGRSCLAGQRPYSVILTRYGGEHDTFRILECDGSIAAEALDRLSVIARPPGIARPELPLPIEPESDADFDGEWIPNVRMLDPRLLWVVARIAEAFPYRPIYVISGYRRDGHGSFHRKGRALDLFVMNSKNEDVLALCRTLKDVGCGYYPNNKFVHVDVRPPGTGHALWVDSSAPGQPSHYVDSWPGVIAGGALAWMGAED